MEALNTNKVLIEKVIVDAPIVTQYNVNHWFSINNTH